MTSMKAIPNIVIMLFVAVALSSGCTLRRSQVGYPLGAASAAELFTGQAKAEVLERLGPPDRVTMNWDESVFEYLYREKLGRELELSFWQANFDYKESWQKSDRLVIRFDRDGHVRDYGVNLETDASRSQARTDAPAHR